MSRLTTRTPHCQAWREHYCRYKLEVSPYDPAQDTFTVSVRMNVCVCVNVCGCMSEDISE